MPAVTVENILVLPRVAEPDVTQAERTVTSVTTAPPFTAISAATI